MSDRSTRVVIVEDDASLRRAMQRLLQVCGLSTDAYESAECYVDAGVAIDDYDCFVLDLHLPGMSGVEMMDRCAIPGAKTVCITAYDDDASRLAARQRSVAAFLPKPFQGDALLVCVSDVIGYRLSGASGHERSGAWSPGSTTGQV
ncbi:response regulator [Uliginosibacterium sp. H3]|uniref:Response regulator n=1 Tax=Uliginosibacterium silvisoli TaxID=3114758 RepID=A0ABU6K215_9RHOO|nr:response regulator [Uliginosibacterium sp. H3]